MRVTRSLTIKQMATVSAVTLIIVCLFIVLQLFHFVQQRRIDYAQQMENVAHTIRKPLSEAVLKADIPQVERILNTLKPAGVIARADIVLPNNIPALHSELAVEQPVPDVIAELFELPVTIRVPLYSPERTMSGPLASLVLQANSARVYQFIRATVATMLIAYFLLALMLTIAISWCINRQLVRPIRRLAVELDNLPSQDLIMHQLSLPDQHRDDELGQFILSYNQNQQKMAAIYSDMRRLTTHDSVTDLPNKALFLALVEQYLHGLQTPTTLAVMVIRIDTPQHSAASLNKDQRDALPLIWTERLRSGIDQHSVLARIGDNEFALLSLRATNPFRALRLAHALTQQLTHPVILEQQQLRPVACIGMTLTGQDTVPADDLLNRASSAMMAACSQGTNQIRFFDPVMETNAQQDFTRQHYITQALAESNFALFLQPQVDMRTGHTVGAEALLRMRQPDGSWSLPPDLITHAEKSGGINTLGRWVLEEACRVLAGWQTRDIRLPLSVNLSAIQLREPDMVSHLEALLSRYPVRPGSLILEITETAQVDNLPHTLQQLQKLRQAGVAIALDDFGMGYANLDWLHQFKALPVSKLKVDRSFVADLPDDDTMVRILAAIATIMSLDVVAEGVETATQRDWLLARGITIGQGYFYSQPLAAECFEQRFLAEIPPSFPLSSQ